MTSVLWLRRDLRVHDHPALLAAHDADGPVVPLFVADPALLASAGPPRLAALHDALAGLRDATDGALVVRQGRPEDVVAAVAREVGATSVHVSAETTPYGRRRDARVEQALADAGVPLVASGSPYAVTPGRVLGTSGQPYQVFTPFARAWRDHGWRRPAAVPGGLRRAPGVAGDDLPGADAVRATARHGPARGDPGRGAPAVARLPRRRARALRRPSRRTRTSRGRMVVASFLVKDLHVWWGHGARWFMAGLRDGDIASNSHGWQWVAGTGTDASPYFRIFNPVTQGRRFDPDGAYVRRYVPELAHVVGAAAHEPWTVGDGYAQGYPERLVDHAAERAEALRRYGEARA